MPAKLYEFLKHSSCKIFVTSGDKENFLAQNIFSYLELNTYYLPDFRANVGDDLRSFSEEFSQLLVNLNYYFNDKSPKKVLVLPIRTLLRSLPNAKLLHQYTISFGDQIDFKILKDKLLFWGYNYVDVVEAKGEVSFRGDILDIYPPNLDEPVRVSFFDDEVESIRYFETQTQKSLKDELECFTLFPAIFSLDESRYNALNDKVQTIPNDAFLKDIASLGLWALEKSDTIAFLNESGIFISDEAYSEISDIELEDKSALLALKKLPENKEYKDIVVSGVKEFIDFHKDKKITILANNEALVKSHDIELNENIKYKKSPYIVNVLSRHEVVISLNTKERRKRRVKRPPIVLDELNINDYVVHENYGIGVFKGLVNTTVLGSTKDFVQIEYQGDDKLLLPVENLDVIDRYISESGTLAVVDKLGKGGFSKLKQKVKAKLFEIAQQIVNMAAQRELVNGKKIKIDERVLSDFALSSGFIYTKDQEKSLQDIFSDLKSGNVMDRLLSADVGFGKTEVAMNAILSVVKNGFQALLIAPTTLLSSQHFKTLHERLSPFGIRVRKLDRFVSTKEKNTLLKELEDGCVDVVVGTHALLGVKIKNLGLLVIDEEHKFGVKQKEKLKQLKENVHILSMSATPIPRSLNMALSSIKGYSQILTPPSDREDVRTFVKEWDDKLLKEVFLRELRRGGQIFYVHNRIASIEQKVKELREIYPKLRILTLHSKISASVSEKEMLKFENKEYDMLVSTSIIESGIHLPNVNTIIIESADRFGMADLHQLRGRVGRGKNQGYCYFLVDDKNALSEQAKKRLVALEANSFLGSGSVLAYHDLEIRGGGNLIGEAQSGHIKNIGYSLYLKMLEDAINLLLNKHSVQLKDMDMKLSISAYLSSELIAEDRVRLELYRRLSKCKSPNEVFEIEGEIEDRFGRLDTPTTQFLQMMIVKILATSKEIKSISNYGQNITLLDKNDDKTLLKSKSKDDDDILDTLLVYLRKKA